MAPVELYSVQAAARAVFNTATMGATYAKLNGTGFSAPLKMLVLLNLGTNGIDISWDGVNDADFLPGLATGTNPVPRIYNFQSNHACSSSYSSGTWNVKQGQILYGKGTAGTGNIYIIGYY